MVAEMMGKCGKFMGQSSRNDGLNMFEIWNTCFFWGGEIPEVYKCRIFPARLDYRRVIQIQLLLCALFWKKSIVQGDIRSTSSTHIIRKDY